MVTPDILEYIRTNLANGFAKEDLQKTLMASGWSEADIQSAFQTLESGAQGVATPPESEEQRIANELAREQLRQKNRPASVPTTQTTGATGMIGFLITKGIVQNESQANVLLGAIAAIAFGVAVWNVWPSAPKAQPPGPRVVPSVTLPPTTNTTPPLE